MEQAAITLCWRCGSATPPKSLRKDNETITLTLLWSFVLELHIFSAFPY